MNTYYEESLNLKVTHSSDQELIPNYSYSRFQHEAFSTWILHYDAGDQKKTSHINGTLTCFCENEYAHNGLWSAIMSYRVEGLD